MPVNEVLMGLGSWNVTLVDETPRTVLDRLEFFGHVAFIPGRVEPAQYGDTLLTMARYVGVLTGRDFDHLRKVVDGQSTAVWLGDADDKGEVFETPVVINGSTFPNSIRALLGAGTAVVEGTLYAGIPGTYKGRHVWQSRRKAISYVCDTMGAEWRVTGDCKLDAGPASSLFKAAPDCVIIRKRPNHVTDGHDLTLKGLRGDMGVARDVDDFTTRVVVIAEGEGESTATGAATNPANPYLDVRGQPINRVRLVSESGTTPGNANARAQLQLNRYLGTRNAMRLTTDDYDIRGAFTPGDWVWVYDPDSGLFDTSQEITFRGERINPIKLRMAGANWPVRSGMTVAYRHQDGTWLDLTPYVDWEGGETTVDVGELLKALSSAGMEPVGPRPIPDSTIPGTVAWDLPFLTSSYQDAVGATLARILVAWTLPLNVDGSTILDGDHYEIRYGVSPATDWQVAYAPWGDLQAMVTQLSPGVTYDFQIRAVDASGNVGAWSATETAVASEDVFPPSTPAPPTVAGSRMAIQITHTLGKASGGTYNLELDLDHLEVHVGASSGFTADSTTLKGKVSAHAGMIAAGVPAVGTVDVEETTTRYVKVIAVDQAGNRSSASTAATATALLIDSAHISDLTASKITAGSLLADIVLGARIKTADTGARVELNSGGIGAWNAGNVQTVGMAQADGSFFLRSASTGARVDISSSNGLRLFDSGGTNTVSLANTGAFTLRTATSGARMEMDTSGLRAYNSGGTQTVDIASTGNVTVQGEVRSAVSGRRIVFNPAGSTNPTIALYPPTGTDATKIASPLSSSQEAELRVDTGTGTNGRRGTLFMGSGYCYLGTNIAPSDFGATEIRLNDDTVSIQGKLISSGTTAKALEIARVTVGGTAGTVAWGSFDATPASVATVKAGNSGSLVFTNQDLASFTWLWSGIALTSGFDYINYGSFRV